MLKRLMSLTTPKALFIIENSMIILVADYVFDCVQMRFGAPSMLCLTHFT